MIPGANKSVLSLGEEAVHGDYICSVTVKVSDWNDIVFGPYNSSTGTTFVRRCIYHFTSCFVFRQIITKDCNTLHHLLTHCSTFQHTLTLANTLDNTLLHLLAHCNTF